MAPVILRALTIAVMGPQIGTKRRLGFVVSHEFPAESSQVRSRRNSRMSGHPSPSLATKKPRPAFRSGLEIRIANWAVLLRVVDFHFHFGSRWHLLELGQRTEALRFGLPSAAAGREQNSEDGQAESGGSAEHGGTKLRFFEDREKNDDGGTQGPSAIRRPLQIES
jgi:hypothetical protein